MNQSPVSDEETSAAAAKHAHRLASVVGRIDAMRGAPAGTPSASRSPRLVAAVAPAPILALALALAIALVIVTTLLVRRWHGDEAAPRAGTPAATVAGADAAADRADKPAARRPSTGEIRLTGNFSAKQISRVTTTVVGRITRIAVSAGSEVLQGEVLAELDPVSVEAETAALRARLDAQNAQLASDRLELERAQNNLARQNELVLKGFISAQAAEQARLAGEQAAMKVAMSQAQRQELEHNLAASDQRRRQYAVLAPFAGKIVTVTGSVGEVATPGGYEERFARSGLFTLVGKGSMRVETAVQESLFAQVRDSGCAIVTSTSQPRLVSAHPFVIDEVSQSVDKQRGTITVFLVARPSLPDYPALDSEAEVVYLPSGDRRCAAPRA